MCGLIGILSTYGTNDVNKFFIQGLFADTLRGGDGTGMILVNEKTYEVETLKMGDEAPRFLKDDKTKELLSKNIYKLLMGHNRYATMGKTGTKQAHPFKYNNIYFMHNGIIRNAIKLAKEHKIEYEVDSEVAMYLIGKLGPKEAIKQLDGAFCLTWYNEEDKTFNTIRNYERPLHIGISETNNKIVYGSERGLLAWLLERNKFFGNYKFEELPVGELWSIKVDSTPVFEINKEEIDLYKAPIIPYYGYHGASNNWNNNMSKKDKKKNILKKYGLEFGSSIEFTVHEFVPYKKNNGLGKMFGCMVNDPWLSVEIHGASKDEADKWIDGCEKDGTYMILSGNIFTCNILPQDDISLHINNVKALGQEIKGEVNDKEKTVLHLPKKDIEPPRVGQALCLPFDEEKEVVYLPGPNKRLLTEKEFLQRTKDGCCQCSGDLTPEDAHKIEWTNNGEPMCIDCVQYWKDQYKRHGIH